jgi:hypothetical protein
MRLSFEPLKKIAVPAVVLELEARVSGDVISTSPKTRVIDRYQNAACFFDRLIVYDSSSPGQRTGMVAELENTN